MSALKIKLERELGDVLGDGMKIVFRNFKVIFSAIMLYVLPFVIGSLILLIISGSYMRFFELSPDISDSELLTFFSSAGIFGLGIGIGYVMIGLVIYSTIIDYYQHDGKVNSIRVHENIKNYIGNYLLSILTEVGIIGLLVTLVLFSAIISPVLFGLLYLVAIFVGAWVLNIIQFLGIVRIEEGLSISEGLNRCFYLVRNQWWNTFGSIFLASLIGGMITYMVIITITVVSSIVILVQDLGTLDQGGIAYAWLMGTSMIFSTLINIMTNLFVSAVRALKYYDLVEKKESRNLIAEIEKIGDRGDTIFENEGEF